MQFIQLVVSFCVRNGQWVHEHGRLLGFLILLILFSSFLGTIVLHRQKSLQQIIFLAGILLTGSAFLLSPQIPSWIKWLLSITGMLICLFGTAKIYSSSQASNSFWILLVITTMLGLFIRLAWLDSVPACVNDYAAAAGINAMRAIDNGLPPLFWHLNPGTIDHSKNSPLYQLLLMGSFSSFGRTIFALRIVDVILGTLTIPLLFFLGNVLIGRFPSLIAAFFLAISPWHVSFSRVGLTPAGTLLIQVSLMLLLWIALEKKTIFAFAGIGILFAMIPSFYAPLRIAFPGVVLYLAQRFLHAPRKNLFILSRGLIIFIVASALFIPQIGELRSLHNRISIKVAPYPTDTAVWYRQGLDKVTNVFNVSDGIKNIYKNLIEVHSFFTNNPGLNPVVVLALLLGFVCSVRRVTEKEYLFILYWAVLTALPALLIYPSASRLITFLGPMMLLVGVFFDQVLSTFRMVLKKRVASLLMILLLSIVLIFCMCEEVYRFFGPHLVWFVRDAVFGSDGRALLMPYLLKECSDSWVVLLGFRYYDRNDFEFRFYDIEQRMKIACHEYLQTTQDLDASLSRFQALLKEKNLVFAYIRLDSFEEFNTMLQRSFPTGVLTGYPQESEIPRVYIFRAPKITNE